MGLSRSPIELKLGENSYINVENKIHYDIGCNYKTKIPLRRIFTLMCTTLTVLHSDIHNFCSTLHCGIGGVGVERFPNAGCREASN